MKIIIGLGNPGKDYEKTRHNVGFNAIDTLAAKWEEYFKVERNEKLYEAKEYEIHIAGQKETVLLAKPLTFMNRSGEAVKALVKKYGGKIAVQTDVIVMHDELDVVLGRVKIDHGSSSAGHNGVQNIIDQLGTKVFTRLRIGVLPLEGIKIPVEDFVLRPFSKEEQKEILKILDVIPDMLQCLFEKGIGEAQTVFNRKTK